MMAEINNATIRAAIVDYVSNGNTVPDGMDVNAYVDATYDMDKLIDSMRSACEDEDIAPADLDPDVFVELLSDADVGVQVEADFYLTEQARTFGFGYRAVESSYVFNDDAFYAPSDSHFRATLYINEATFGKVGNIYTRKLKALADAFADGPDEYARMRADDHEHSFLETDCGLIDLTTNPNGFYEIDGTVLSCMWYFDGERAMMDIPMVITEDNR